MRVFFILLYLFTSFFLSRVRADEDSTQDEQISEESGLKPSTTVMPFPPPQTPEGFDFVEDRALSEALENPGCGNGVVEKGEACDDGNTESLDGCSADCKKEGDSLACGDGELNEGEECDDGNQRNGDGCSAACESEGERRPSCGDGILDRGEQCDDGNVSDSDSCTSKCQNARCGDGFVQPGEECDDTNTLSGDGCSAFCLLENTKALCGNRIMEAGETCDDGNQTSNDGCSSICRKEICGDGIVQLKEQCESTLVCPAAGFVCDTTTCACVDCKSLVKNLCTADSDCPSGSVRYTGQDCVMDVGICTPANSVCPNVPGNICSFRTDRGQWDNNVTKQIHGTSPEGCTFTCDSVQKSCAGAPVGVLTYSNIRITGGSYLIPGDFDNCSCSCQTGLPVGGPGCVDKVCPGTPAINCSAV